MNQPNDRRPRDANDGGWHLDKKVPITIVFALLMQTVSFTWYMAKQDARISLIEATRIDYRASQKDRDAVQDKALSDTVTEMRARLDKIDNKLDRVNDKLSERK